MASAGLPRIGYFARRRGSAVAESMGAACYDSPSDAAMPFV